MLPTLKSGSGGGGGGDLLFTRPMSSPILPGFNCPYPEDVNVDEMNSTNSEAATPRETIECVMLKNPFLWMIE
jgi:hypothetical protein